MPKTHIIVANADNIPAMRKLGFTVVDAETVNGETCMKVPDGVIVERVGRSITIKGKGFSEPVTVDDNVEH